MKLLSRYLARLNLTDEVELPLKADLATLQLLTERHLDLIPFENTFQHGIQPDSPASLDMEVTAAKILDDNRGGFCFEMNLLFAKLLEELGYPVTLLMSNVFLSADDEKKDPSTLPPHVTPIVLLDDGTRYLVDVGFGEPAYHPIEYCLDKEQQTPEGMVCKMCEEGTDSMRLYWKKEGQWRARLHWSKADALLPPDKSPCVDLIQPHLTMVAEHPQSPFVQKLIVCRINKTHKYTLAGNKYKVTLRSFDEAVAPKIVEQRVIESNEAARELLRDVYNVPLASSEGLELATSQKAANELWSNF